MDVHIFGFVIRAIMQLHRHSNVMNKVNEALEQQTVCMPVVKMSLQRLPGEDSPPSFCSHPSGCWHRHTVRDAKCCPGQTAAVYESSSLGGASATYV